MSTPLPQKSQLLLITIIGLISGIFLLDLLTPVGVIVGMLYVIPVYLAGWLPLRRGTFLVAATCTVLAVLSYFVSPPGGVPWIALTNRFLAVVAIWTTVFLAWFHHRMCIEIKTLRGLLSICASCKKIRDERGSWKSLETYIESHSEAQFTHCVCPICEKVYEEELAALRTSANMHM